jgi:hypothetical protein
MDLAEAGERAARVRDLYHQLEERYEGSRWSARDDMLGLTSDVGMLGRLVMATEGRWQPEGNVPELLAAKLSECLWWILVLGGRLEVDIEAAFDERMDKIEAHLLASIAAE